jgi:hypothetical protein
MSTKATISYSDKHHLYEEVFDDEHIYLSLIPETWTFDGTEIDVEMKNELWEKIVLSWLGSRYVSPQTRLLAEQALKKQHDLIREEND